MTKKIATATTDAAPRAKRAPRAASKKAPKREKKIKAPKEPKAPKVRAIAVKAAPKKRTAPVKRVVYRGPHDSTVKRFVKAHYGGDVRLHGEAVPVVAGVYEAILSGFEAQGRHMLAAPGRKRKTFSRKDGRYAVVNIMGRAHQGLCRDVINREEAAVNRYNAAVDAAKQ